MNLRHLLAGGATAFLIAAAGHAQPSYGTSSNPPPSTPAPPEPSSGGATPTIPSTGQPATLPSYPTTSGTPAQPSPAAPPPSAQATPPAAPAAGTYGQAASFTNMKLASSPVPDTPENRRKYGGPMSRAGRRTAASGN